MGNGMGSLPDFSGNRKEKNMKFTTLIPAALVATLTAPVLAQDIPSPPDQTDPYAGEQTMPQSPEPMDPYADEQTMPPSPDPMDPRAGQEMPDPMDPRSAPHSTDPMDPRAGHDTMDNDGHSPDQKAQYDAWPSDVRDYYNTLSADRQEMFWRISDTDKTTLVGMSAEEQEAVWQRIESMSASTAPMER